ncbi:MAG TPA: hypothetical protein VGH03_14580 [Caulobacteraceae bacterium]
MDVPSREAAEPPAFECEPLLKLLGVGPGQAVGVAGPGSLEIMVALCRAGWARVECALQATCAGADETSDLLILTGPPERLGALTAKTARLLRDGGVLLAFLDHPEDDAPIRAALLGKGLSVTASVLDSRTGCVIAHRVERPALLARTA